ncbi:PTS mannose/fructose/sorbose transporter subunit IIAB [Tetragenococcus halophilus]|uniref:PTS mannose/fructose/sorbose transporter subunit IIAB n=1 Tax=Tetragenococcus halophilus TaxID=51669 RepID=UPI0015BDCBB1|nr:PTS mannose/fructose/sorbose transporter subunit IIAB [Tetragenococcus halophilus]NWO01249.1 PTS transporter subunit IIB [Tetragenococcus halophilus]
MYKFVVAAHGKLAQGYKSTIEMFLGTSLDIDYITTYTEDSLDLEEQITQILASLAENTQLIIFTDLFSGSVNQKFITTLENRPEVFIISGTNLPAILEVMTISMSGEKFTQELIEEKLESARQEIKQYPLYKKESKDKKELAQENKKVSQKQNQQVNSDEENTKIPALRVDERLVHGQIVMMWSKALSLEGIIVANDEVANDLTQQSSLKLAVPSNIKIVIRTLEGARKLLKDSRIANMNVLVLTKTIADAAVVTEGFESVDFLNIGNVGKATEGKKEKWTNTVFVTDKEVEAAKQLAQQFSEIKVQNVPADTSHSLNEFL